MRKIISLTHHEAEADKFMKIIDKVAQKAKRHQTDPHNKKAASWVNYSRDRACKETKRLVVSASLSGYLIVPVYRTLTSCAWGPLAPWATVNSTA